VNRRDVGEPSVVTNPVLVGGGVAWRDGKSRDGQGVSTATS